MGFWEQVHAFSVRWHDLGDILGAAAAAAAVIFSVVSAWRSANARRVAEVERDAAQSAQRVAEEAAAAERREQQARAVAVWATAPMATSDPEDDGNLLDQNPYTGETGYYVPVVHVANHSAMPIFDIRAELIESTGEYVVWPALDLLPPGEHGSLYAQHIRPGVGPAGRASVSFRDTAGHLWRRSWNGDLQQIISSPPGGGDNAMEPAGSERGT